MALSPYALIAFLLFFFSPSPDERARDVLKAGVDSKDPGARLQTVIASSLIGSNPEVIGRLEKLLGDKDVAVRVAAVNALADLKARSSIPALQRTLAKDEVPEVAFAAAKALYIFNDAAGKEALNEVFDRRISGKSNAIRKQARDFFGKFRTLKSSVMMVVTEGIGFVPVPGAGAGISALTELLEDPELSTRASVVLLLGRAKTAEADDVLRRAVTDKDWTVRAAAAQTIAQSGRLNLQDQLLPLLDDSKDKVRFRAAGAYLHLSVLRQRTRR